MDNKKLGVIILVIGILLAVFVFVWKANQDKITNEMLQEQGTCFLDDGTCLHAQSSNMYLLGLIFSVALIALSLYLLVFEKSSRAILSTLEKQKHIQTEEEKFNILLKGLTKEEQKVIKAVKDQDGITQQTLRLRTDMHKSKLSIILDGLEKKDLIARKTKGKTKQVFLKFKL